MTYKQIEASREARLWIGQVIVPAVVGGVALMSNQNTRNYVTSKYYDVKYKIQQKFKKK